MYIMDTIKIIIYLYVDEFTNILFFFLANNLNDVTCTASESSELDYRFRTNLYIVMDSTWQYDSIYPAISYLLDYIDVGKFGSSVTMLSSFDGSIVVNTTFSLAEFHSRYTRQTHTASKIIF